MSKYLPFYVSYFCIATISDVTKVLNHSGKLR